MSKVKIIREPKDKMKLEDIIKELKEKYGEGVIMKLGEAKKVDVDAIPTGSLSLDLALGVGGVPRGRIIEIFGNESSGKTSLALHIVGEAQKRGGTAAFIDAEHALDPDYAKKIGVNIDNLLISQPDTGEDALDIVETLVSSKTVDVIVVDSVAALTPRAEIEGSMDQQQMGLQARLMAKALRKITAIAAKSGTIIIFINQVRQKIGIRFGDPETTPGGKALKFYSSVRIKLTRAAKIAKGTDIIGNRVIAKVVKNKVAPPFKETEFDILYDQGISRLSDVVKTAERYGVITKKGNTYQFGSEALGVGLDKAREWLKERPKEAEAIINGTKKAYFAQTA
ncbi:MAG: recombinase RecA [Candidatus Portnoybacteria bacterium]|nr:recombinase RecA [Candidatus Portnoybacteria bacterium]